MYMCMITRCYRAPTSCFRAPATSALCACRPRRRDAPYPTDSSSSSPLVDPHECQPVPTLQVDPPVTRVQSTDPASIHSCPLVLIGVERSGQPWDAVSDRFLRVGQRPRRTEGFVYGTCGIIRLVVDGEDVTLSDRYC